MASQRDWLEILQHVVLQSQEWQPLTTCVLSRQRERVPIGRRARDAPAPMLPAAPVDVLDDEGLAERHSAWARRGCARSRQRRRQRRNGTTIVIGRDG